MQCKFEREADRQTDRQRDKQANRMNERTNDCFLLTSVETDRQTLLRQTNGQTETETDRQPDKRRVGGHRTDRQYNALEYCITVGYNNTPYS